MKKILLTLAFSTLAVLNGYSQSKKNDLKLTVSGLPLIGNTNDYKGVNGFVIKPALGYYISDKTSLELNLSYAAMNNVTIENVNSYYQSYAFVPTVRNNFINNKKLRAFAEIGFGLGTIKYNADNKDFNNYSHELLSGGISIITIGIGGNYYFNDNFGLEFILPYINSFNITSEQSNTIYAGIGPTLGLTYKLN
jgi:outer membrane protein W